MKLITLEKVLEVLEKGTNMVHVSEEISKKSLLPLERMLEIAR